MDVDPLFYFMFLQIICTYVTLHNKNNIASTEVALMFVILTIKSVLPLILTFEMTLILLNERWPLVLLHVIADYM